MDWLIFGQITFMDFIVRSINVYNFYCSYETTL
jgi:hypothetical protein